MDVEELTQCKETNLCSMALYATQSNQAPDFRKDILNESSMTFFSNKDEEENENENQETDELSLYGPSKNFGLRRFLDNPSH